MTTFPSKFFSPLQSYCPRLSVVLLSYDSRSTLIRRDGKEKFGRVRVFFSVSFYCIYIRPLLQSLRAMFSRHCMLAVGSLLATYALFKQNHGAGFFKYLILCASVPLRILVVNQGILNVEHTFVFGLTVFYSTKFISVIHSYQSRTAIVREQND